jgi:two-component system NtrC family sensor kinase
MLLKQYHDGAPGKEDIQMIVSEATRCRNIMRGLLDFARHSRISKTQTDIKKLIDEVVSIMSLKAREEYISVTCNVQDALPMMMVDSSQVKQMLVNLVQNGIDAIAESGEVSISAHLNEAGDYAEIEVSDNGSGIPRENISELFNPFYTTKEMGKGTGLGLSIVYGIVKMHSGDISVDSKLGKGTTFLIKLPLAGKEENEGEAI